MSEADSREEIADDELCRIARGGEVWPLEVFWRRYGAEARSWASKKDASVAEDIVAEGFALVFQALLAGGGPSESFRGYLYKTMESLFARHWRAQKRVSPLDDEDVLALEHEESHSRTLVEAQERDAAATALTELPERWREVITAVDIEGRPVQEVARDLDLSPNSTSVLLKRAREGLRKGWVQHLHRPAPGLSQACASAIKHFGVMRWGKKGTRRRTETERHLAECASCRSRYTQFLEQAMSVGLGLTGLIALTRDWRERLIPTLATSAAVTASFSMTVSLAPVPFDPPPRPDTAEVVEVPSPETGSGEQHGVGTTGRPAGRDGADTTGAGEQTADGTVDRTEDDAQVDELTGEEGTEILYFGDWTGWDEQEGRFSRTP